MKVMHLDYQPGGASRVVFSGNLAWFTGHAAPQFPTLAQQTAGVLRRYDELFAQFGLKKENILYAICFLKNADDEEDFKQEYFKWIAPGCDPAGFTVTGVPIQHSPVGDNVLIELQFIVATEENAVIERYDAEGSGARMVKYDGMCYFTGHVCPRFATLPEQTAGVLRRYDELFERFGLKKENVVMQHGFVKDIDDGYDGMCAAFADYFGENPPAGVVVEARPNQATPFGDNLQIELALFVATGEKGDVVRRDVVPGMARVVEYNGLAWFTGHSARPEFVGMLEQTKALCARYDELFAQFGYRKENLVMMYGFMADIEEYKDFDAGKAGFECPDAPAAGVLVQARPSGEGNRLELQYILALDD